MANDLNKGSVTYADNRRDFLESLKSFHALRGTPFDRLPKIEGRSIDLYHLYRRVTDLGGWKKVNQLLLWDNILEEFNIPEGCSNGIQILQYAYIRFLKLYEKVKFWGNDPDDDLGEGRDGHSRKKVCLPLESIPKFYNYSQHQVSDAERKTNKLSNDLAKHGDYDKLEMSLRSGLANEVDFALNVCLVLSAEDRDFVRLTKTRSLLSLLMATVGLFEQGPASMRDVMTYSWNNGEPKRDYAQFWLDVVTNEPIRESIKTESDISIEDEKLGSEVLSFNRGLSAKDAEGQRATQVAMLIRNLSFEDDNQKLMASNPLVFRFLMRCVHSSYGTLRHLALDTLGNIAVQMVLEPTSSSSTQYVMNVVQNSVADDDKFAMVRGLEVLSKLCKVKDNEAVLNKSLEEGTYCRLVQLLLVHDVQVVIQSLEALYQLSAVGESTATKIAHVRCAVDILVSMVTVDVQSSYGPEARQSIQVVEYMAADTEGNANNPSSAQPCSYFVEADAAYVPPVPEEPPSQLSSEQVAVNKKVTPEVEILVSKWLSSTYEVSSGSSVAHTELYAEYQEMCKKRRITRLLSVPDLTAIVKSVLPEVCVAEVDKGGGGTETVFKGMTKCPQPKPFTVLASSAASCYAASVACQTPFPTMAAQPSDQVAGRPSCQPPVALSSAQQTSTPARSQNHPLATPSALQNHPLATPSALQNHPLATPSALQKKPPATGASHKVTACTKPGRIYAGLSSSLSKSSVCNAASTAVSSSSSSADTNTWITIPCDPETWKKNLPTVQKGGKKASKGQQALGNDAIKTLLAQKVCQQKGSPGGGSAAASPGPQVQNLLTLPASAESTPTPQHPELLSKLQQHIQTQNQLQAQQQQQQQQTQVLTNPLQQVVWTHQPLSGHNQLHIAHAQQTPHTDQRGSVVWNSAQFKVGGQGVLVRPASAVVPLAQQSVTPHQQLTQSQTLQLQQQPVGAESSLQAAAQTPTQSSQQDASQQQSFVVQNNQQSVQAPLPQNSVVPQSQSALLRQLITANSPVVVKPRGQTGLTLSQQSVTVRPSLQGHSEQVGQPQVGQPQVGQPQVGQPQVGQPQVGQPQVGQPQVGQPQVGQPQVVHLQPQVQQQQVVNVQGQQVVLRQQGLQPQQVVHIQSRGLGQPQTLSLTPGQAQSLSLPPGQAQTLSLTAGQAQSLSLTPGQAQTLSLTPGQAQSLSLTPGQAQALSLTPGQTQSLSLTPGQAQTLSLTPGQAQSLSLTPGQAQTLSLIPGQAQSLSLTAGQSQTLSLTPGQAHTLSLTPGQSQTLSLTPGQPQTVALPAGQVLLRANTTQPVHIQPHPQIVMQQGQPRQIIIQGQSGLQHILQQQLHIQGSGQGQAVRIQQPGVIQLPVNQWPQIAASQTVSVRTNALPNTTSPLTVGNSVTQGASTSSYRAIIPRPSSNPSQQCSQQASVSWARQQASDSSIDLRKVGAAQGSVMGSSQGLLTDQTVNVRTDGAVPTVPSVGLCQPLDIVSGVCGASAEGMIQASVQTFAPSTVSRASGMSVCQSSVSSSSLSSQYPSVLQSSSVVPSIQNGHRSESSSPHPPSSPGGCAAKHNGFVNGTKLHKEGIYNRVHIDLTAESPSVGKGKVNGVLGSAKSNGSCPLMNLSMKKEFVNGVGERCVPVVLDSVTGCSKEWLKDLCISQYGQSSHKPIVVDDDFPPQRGTTKTNTKTDRKASVWQKNGLTTTHSGGNNVSKFVNVFDPQTLDHEDSMSENSLDSIDSSNSGSQPLLSSTGTQAGCANGQSQGLPKNYFFRVRKRSRSFRQLHEEGVVSSSSSESESESSEVPNVCVFAKQSMNMMKKKVVPKPQVQKEAPPSKKKKTSVPSRQALTTPKEITYMCEWSKCGRVFSTADRVLVHAVKVHVPPTPELPEYVCQWESCQPLKRKRLSLITHLQDHHCTQAKQRTASERRFLMSHKAILPHLPQPPLMVYPEDAAQQAIQRFQRQPPFAEFSEEKECTMTKHIRLTSALTLRNIARNSALGRRLIRRKEGALSYAAMSEVESSGALATCLWELIQDM
ncbi:hypothetical protein ACOMHN_054044 [Nucella lapillus]